MENLKAGIVGCGNISTAYLELAKQFEGYDIVACADLNQALADSQAEQFGCRSLSVDDMMADDDVDIIINLTVPAAHYTVSRTAILSGKHVYSEKPFVLSLSEGTELNELADKRGVRIGSAPDTFLGGAHQRARELVDNGTVGQIVGGSCYFQSHGMEHWHPNPDFFFQPGAGPILDMGAYYVSNLVQLIGPVSRVVAMASKPFETRTISSEPRAGETIPVDVATTVNAILEFEQGAQITLCASWDVWASNNNLIELHGTEKSMFLPDPNHFGGDIVVKDSDSEESVSPLGVLSSLNYENANGDMTSNYRGIGLADMAMAIKEGREHRCNCDLALHVMDTLMSILRSAETGSFVSLSTTCQRPLALPDNLASALVSVP